MFVLLSRTQAGPGKIVKQEQEEISRNHLQDFIPDSVRAYRERARQSGRHHYLKPGIALEGCKNPISQFQFPNFVTKSGKKEEKGQKNASFSQPARPTSSSIHYHNRRCAIETRSLESHPRPARPEAPPDDADGYSARVAPLLYMASVELLLAGLAIICVRIATNLHTTGGCNKKLKFTRNSTQISKPNDRHSEGQRD